jgi:hypothetical protein
VVALRCWENAAEKRTLLRLALKSLSDVAAAPIDASVYLGMQRRSINSDEARVWRSPI